MHGNVPYSYSYSYIKYAEYKVLGLSRIIVDNRDGLFIVDWSLLRNLPHRRASICTLVYNTVYSTCVCVSDLKSKIFLYMT